MDFAVAIRVLSDSGSVVVLGSLVHSDYGQQLPWLLDQLLRCLALLRTLGPIGVEPPVLDPGAR
jgi:hypothetical protein